jgi:hypothetical protein
MVMTTRQAGPGVSAAASPGTGGQRREALPSAEEPVGDPIAKIKTPGSFDPRKVNLDLEIRLAYAASESLAAPANPEQPPTPIKGGVTHVTLRHNVFRNFSWQGFPKVLKFQQKYGQQKNDFTAFFSLFDPFLSWPFDLPYASIIHVSQESEIYAYTLHGGGKSARDQHFSRPIRKILLPHHFLSKR